MRIAICLLMGAMFLPGCHSAQDIDTYLKKLHAAGELNGNVLVMRSDTVLYKNSFGYADGARQNRLSPEHRFAIGSIYKEFPAVAIMQLREQGLLTLDGQLSSFVPHLPGWADKITVRHLLQYSSGLPKVDWKVYFEKSRQGVETGVDDMVRDLLTLEALAFEPGTDYLYSNYNPFLLIKIVEALTELDFEDYVQKRMLSPFALDGIVIKNQYPYQDTTKIALPFNKAFREDSYHLELVNFCSSTTGMYRWFKQLDYFEIVTKESVKLLSEEAIRGSNIQAPLGRVDWKDDDLVLHLHHGSHESYECLVRNHKQDELIVILLTNQKHSNLHNIADVIYEIATEER